MPALQEVRDARQSFECDCARVGSLASSLGFARTPLRRDLLADHTAALASALTNHPERGCELSFPQRARMPRPVSVTRRDGDWPLASLHHQGRTFR